MAGFSIVVEYLTGYVVATNPASRDSAEWPPHPARLYMALAAAYFETIDQVYDSQAERAALEWLATLAPPDIVLPAHSLRDVRDTYVPVNDRSASLAGTNIRERECDPPLRQDQRSKQTSPDCLQRTREETSAAGVFVAGVHSRRIDH